MAQRSPRHLLPLPASVPAPVAMPDAIVPATVAEQVSTAIREWTFIANFLQLLLRRLVRIRPAFQKTVPGPEVEK